MKPSRILLTINVVLLLFIWIFTGINYGSLPDTIPTHFIFNGTADGESQKNAIWFLPGIASFLFFILFAITKDPKSPMLNVPDSFRNKETLEFFSFSILLPLLLLFSDTIVETILITQGKLQTLSFFSFFLIGILFLVLGIWIYLMIKKGKPANT